MPHRLKDGYGMRPEVVEAAAEQGVKLIVSVDTGIRAAEVVKRAQRARHRRDRHRSSSARGGAAAGGRGAQSQSSATARIPEKNLCGAGVAFKLVQALLARLGWPADKLRRVCESFLKLVAIATVADVVPLTGENRIIVKHGLDGLRPGAESRDCGRCWTSRDSPAAHAPNARQVAFQIAPRINAAGRMDTAKAVVEMFLTSDPARAQELAQAAPRPEHRAPAGGGRDPRDLRERRGRGRRRRAGLLRRGRGIAACWGSSPAAWWSASTARFSCSACNAEDGLAQGSGRSIPAFHLLEALESMADLFLRFGGHEHAAGVTLDPARVDEFRAAVQRLRRRAAESPRISSRASTSTPCWSFARSTKRPSTMCSRWRRSGTAISRRCSPP